MINTLKKYSLLALCSTLLSCGPGGDSPEQFLAASRIPDPTAVSVLGQSAGVTPFIKKLTLRIKNYADVASISYTIEKKTGTVSKPISVKYPRDYLDRKAYYNNAERQLSLPVFGLYADYRNSVTLTTEFRDGSTEVDRVVMAASPYDDPAKIYNAIDVKTARAADSALNFDFIFMKSSVTTPVVIDTDGNIRWIGAGVGDSTSSTFIDSGFVIGAAKTPDVYRIELDGTTINKKLSGSRYSNFHHDLVPGKTGLLAEVDVAVNGVAKIESILAEINENGEVLKEWDMGTILQNAMIKGGNDPANFVRDGFDWFHMNSAVYSQEDNSLLISSRENFVMKIDYDSGDIKWLLGDTSKHWYVDYPSLRTYALTLTEGKTPVGQHALSIASDGNLLLFNNGLGSLNNPAGAPAGMTRTFSAASKYVIDETAKSAREMWTYENEQKIYSDICSSVYENGASNYLVTYSAAFNRTRAKLIGLDSSGNVSFDFEYPDALCNAGWNARPIGFENIVFK